MLFRSVSQSRYGKGLSKEAIWTYKSGVIKYWIVLIEEQLYLVNGDVLKSLEAGGWISVLKV